LLFTSRNFFGRWLSIGDANARATDAALSTRKRDVRWRRAFQLTNDRDSTKPDMPRIDVVATGTLFPFEDDNYMRTRTLFLIDDASLCVAKPVR
jgi:hypothetical protein